MNRHNIESAINIADLRDMSRRRLPRVIFDYLDGGAEDEGTLARNRRALREVALRPRLMPGGLPDTRCTLFNRSLALPFAIGPTGLNALFWDKGDLALARAAARRGIGFSLSTGANATIESVSAEMAAACPERGAPDEKGAVAGAPLWFQLYPWGDGTLAEHLIDRAGAAGCHALIVTADSLTPGNRERDVRAGFAHRPSMSLSTVLDGLAHPGWLHSVWLRNGMPRIENIARVARPGASAAELADFTRTQRNPLFSWRDIARIRARWQGPLLLKGVLHPADALRARDEGLDGVIVSNHGGRQLDGALSSIEALPAIVEAVGGRTAVLIDSGFRRGTDIVKALALGADLVLLGRATLYGLAAGGEAGVDRALDILAQELKRTMQLLGVTSTAQIGPDLLHFPVNPSRQ